MTAAPLASAEPPVFWTAEEAARFGSMSTSAIKRRAGPEGFGFKPGGKGPWRIRPEPFKRWLNGEKLK